MSSRSLNLAFSHALPFHPPPPIDFPHSSRRFTVLVCRFCDRSSVLRTGRAARPTHHWSSCPLYLPQDQRSPGMFSFLLLPFFHNLFDSLSSSISCSHHLSTILLFLHGELLILSPVFWCASLAPLLTHFAHSFPSSFS